MKIRITKTGVFNTPDQPIEVGTILEVSDDFKDLSGKWEKVQEEPKQLEVATPKKTRTRRKSTKSDSE